MTDTAPEFLPPPVPADADLRDFDFMPLRVQRMRDSEVSAVADAEVFRCNVMSWCVAWHQVPAGSLPDDNASLARLLGYGRDVKGFEKLRKNGGLRNWKRALDGRLYHPVVTENVLEALEKRVKASKKGKAGASARWGSGNGSDDANASEKQPPTNGAGNGTGIAQAMPKNGKGREGKGIEEKGRDDARARDPHDRTQSRPIIEAFDQALVEVFGEAHRRDWPQQADHVHAQRLVEQGWSAADCKAVFVKSLKQSKDRGGKPPGGIAFYEKRFAELKPGAVKPPPNPEAERIDDHWARMLESWANLSEAERRKRPQPTREDAEIDRAARIAARAKANQDEARP
jgi:hypothetical protein